jgi:signal transduction histidine kinase
MAAELVIVKGAQAGLVFRLENEETRLGRQGCEIALADNMISRVHARILRQGNGYVIEDLGSRNGVFLNDAKILRSQLTDGARIAVGNTVLQFRSDRTVRKEITASTEHPSTHTITIDARGHEILTAEIDEKDIEAMRRAKSDLAAIYRANQELNTVLDPDQLITRVLDIILAEISQVDICSLHLLQEGTNELLCRQQRHRDAADATASPAFNTSLLRLVLQDRKALLTYDAQHDGRLDPGESIAALNILSAMCVPLQSRDQLLGVLQANTIKAKHHFDREDLKLLTAIGAQAGRSMENALLYEKLAAEKKALHEAHDRLKAAQANLVQSEKLAAVGRLTAGIVHDVKNPMTVILTYAELLERQLKAQGVAKLGELDVIGTLKTIQEGVLHCNEVINRLLQFAKQAPPAKTQLAFNEVVTSAVAFLSHEIKKSKAQLETELAGDLPPIMADANQMRQVLLNLIINALQALKPDGGHILITTAVEQANETAYLVCRIRDNGIGMNDEIKKRIFDPFFTTKTSQTGLGGSGLGLSVSYGIIQNHGGMIAVDSAPDAGSTFSIKLPVADQAQPACVTQPISSSG